MKSRVDVSNHALAPDIIHCFSHLRWDFVYQRPQHLLSRAAKHSTVCFIEEPGFDDGADVVRPYGNLGLLEIAQDPETFVVRIRNAFPARKRRLARRRRSRSVHDVLRPDLEQHASLDRPGRQV
jgi:hypothetical protein